MKSKYDAYGDDPINNEDKIKETDTTIAEQIDMLAEIILSQLINEL